MLHPTRGIVFKTVKYSETSVIATIYTEKLGVQSYIINSVRTKKPRTRAALLQPLTLLEMVVYHREQKKVQRIKEMKPAVTFLSIPFHISKSSLAIFITEVLYKTIKEQESNPEQFGFIFDFVAFLDKTTQSIANLHLVFLLQLSRFLGFHPQKDFDEQEAAFFDFQEGRFAGKKPTHDYFIHLPLSRLLWHLMLSTHQTANDVILNKEQRKMLLHTLITFYKLHIEGFKEVQSLKVLEAVME